VPWIILTDDKHPSTIQLQANQTGREDPFPAHFVGEGTEGNGQKDARDGVEHFLPAKDGGHSLLYGINLAQLLRHGSVWTNGGWVVLAIVREADVGFIDACSRSFGHEGAHVDNGYEEACESDEQYPWLVRLLL
jgi:hypothetical protein